jgi:hypothetical protein
MSHLILEMRLSSCESGQLSTRHVLRVEARIVAG